MDAARLIAAVVLGLVLAASAEAQAPGKVSRIAILAFPSQPHAQNSAAALDSFRRHLRELGWSEGRNIAIEVHRVERDQLDAEAARIVGAGVDLIIAQGGFASLAAKRATPTIPIVMAAADPVGTGVVDSLARPGGNVTGLSLLAHELPGKRLKLLTEMVPRLGRVAAVYPEVSASWPFVVQWLADSERVAPTLGLVLQRVAVKPSADWDAVFAAVRRDGVRGVTVVDSPDVGAQVGAVAAAALRHRVPAVFGSRAHVEAGGLMAYGASTTELWARVAAYVDKILRGAKPADLPVEQSSTFDLTINARTAKLLGLGIPSALRLQATEIIE